MDHHHGEAGTGETLDFLASTDDAVIALACRIKHGASGMGAFIEHAPGGYGMACRSMIDACIANDLASGPKSPVLRPLVAWPRFIRPANGKITRLFVGVP